LFGFIQKKILLDRAIPPSVGNRLRAVPVTVSRITLRSIPGYLLMALYTKRPIATHKARAFD
jgi:hypothetical protein